MGIDTTYKGGRHRVINFQNENWRVSPLAFGSTSVCKPRPISLCRVYSEASDALDHLAVAAELSVLAPTRLSAELGSLRPLRMRPLARSSSRLPPPLIVTPIVRRRTSIVALPVFVIVEAHAKVGECGVRLCVPALQYAMQERTLRIRVGRITRSQRQVLRRKCQAALTALDVRRHPLPEGLDTLNRRIPEAPRELRNFFRRIVKCDKSTKRSPLRKTMQCNFRARGPSTVSQLVQHQTKLCEKRDCFDRRLSASHSPCKDRSVCGSLTISKCSWPVSNSWAPSGPL